MHDNGSIFTAETFDQFLVNCNIRPKKTGFHSPWQNGIYERAIGTLRRELLDHIIPINKRHLEHLLKEYTNRYYNPARTHQGINCRTPILLGRPPETSIADTVLISEPILGVLYHSYRKAD